MKKSIRTILIVAFGVFFLACAARVIMVKLPYWKGRHVYNSTSQQYTEQNSVTENGTVAESAAKNRTQAAGSPEDGTDADSAENAAAAGLYTEKAGAKDGGQAAAGETRPVVAPIRVDFKALKSVNDDVVGWIYCEGTQINYPVLQGETNETYIRTLYTGEGHPSGSIFVDAGNLPEFEDNNTIIYGHHMADGAMFGTLEDWREQEYFDAHPCMWLLTPEQDYRVDLFSAYLVSATHDTFTIFRGGGQQFAAYLQRVVRDSAVKADVETDPEAHYVLLVTCAYTVYDDARTVIHGRLVPVDSAGGIAR